jgi:exodeoxyribonuclease-5
MKFSRQQESALKKVNDWYRSGDKQVFRLFGFAGTGKTTLAKYLAEGIGEDVLFAAYTGKAAHVLQKKGCHNASTIHSLIYRSRDKSKARLEELQKELAALIISMEGMEQEYIENHPKVRALRNNIKEEAKNASQPMFVLNTESEVRNAPLVIIDECSMVDATMGQDLLSFNTPVLVLGDPAQLPPVGSAGFFTENVKPDVMLDEIHRQAKESPILRMATDVREGRKLRIGDWGDNCYVYPKGTKLERERVLEYSQLLVGKNRTRHLMNKRIRSFLGHEGEFPVVGDRLVCLRNNSELGLLNGAIFYTTGVDGVLDGKVHMSVRSEDNPNVGDIQVAALEHHFLGRGNELNSQYWLRSEGQEFDYGYALTVHKSQGSQWDSVAVFDESWGSKQNRQRWLYTAITRAAKEVTVVDMQE